MSELYYDSLSDVCARMKSGELSALAVTEATLARIGELDSQLKAYVQVLAESALETAQRLDAQRDEGKPLGVLHGVPVALKDLLNTRGIATASGTKVMENFIPDEDATVVTRLKEAGAVIVGKTQLTEGAFGVHHPEIDPPKNPWDADYWPGVSSSGSAVAVSAGLAYGALGTDTGGSIRFPSASCGLVGIKPTYGRVSRYGAFALAESLDHIGPMTRSVADAARMLQALAGEDPKDPTTLTGAIPNYAAALAEHAQGLTIGVDWDYVSRGVDEVVVETVREALDVLAAHGALIKEVVLPPSHKTLVRDWAITTGVECARAHAEYYPSQADRYGPVLKGLIELGLNAPEGAYAALEQVRTEFSVEFDRLLEGVDVFIAPCMPTLPQSVEAMNLAAAADDERADFLTFTAPYNYSGHPTITLPAGLAAQGLPRSFQIVGRKLGEPTLIRLGGVYEQAVGFDQHPIP